MAGVFDGPIGTTTSSYGRRGPTEQELYEQMRRKDEEHKQREEILKMQREKERLRYICFLTI